MHIYCFQLQAESQMSNQWRKDSIERLKQDQHDFKRFRPSQSSQELIGTIISIDSPLRSKSERISPPGMGRFSMDESTRNDGKHIPIVEPYSRRSGACWGAARPAQNERVVGFDVWHFWSLNRPCLSWSIVWWPALKQVDHWPWSWVLWLIIASASWSIRVSCVKEEVSVEIVVVVQESLGIILYHVSGFHRSWFHLIM